MRITRDKNKMKLFRIYFRKKSLRYKKVIKIRTTVRPHCEESIKNDYFNLPTRKNVKKILKIKITKGYFLSELKNIKAFLNLFTVIK